MAVKKMPKAASICRSNELVGCVEERRTKLAALNEG
jgi:hypothetical protein